MIDRRPLCPDCKKPHFCTRCADERSETAVATDAAQAARLELVEWLEKSRTPQVRRAARALRKLHGL